MSLTGNRQVTDASIDVQLSMKNLTRAAVGATAVTYEGEQRLEEALRQEQQAAMPPGK